MKSCPDVSSPSLYTEKEWKCTPLSFFNFCFESCTMKSLAIPPATPVAIPNAQTELMALWRLPKVLEYVPVSRSHWWAGIADGKFPKGIKLSERCTVWRASDIVHLIQSLK
jgi:predicted DNA-binding transcriptional regulator AlpA